MFTAISMFISTLIGIIFGFVSSMPLWFIVTTRIIEILGITAMIYLISQKKSKPVNDINNSRGY